MDVIENVNRIANKLLSGACVESYGIQHQFLFLEFRNSYGDIQFFIDSDLELSIDLGIEGLTKEQKELLILNHINLKCVKTVKCTDASDIVFTFSDNTILKISGTPIEETSVEPWQLKNMSDIHDLDYVSIIASSGGGYAVWGSLEGIEEGLRQRGLD